MFSTAYFFENQSNHTETVKSVTYKSVSFFTILGPHDNKHKLFANHGLGDLKMGYLTLDCCLIDIVHIHCSNLYLWGKLKKAFNIKALISFSQISFNLHIQ